MNDDRVGEDVISEDHVALNAACEAGTGLCTIVGIEGSFSRRLGSQLAVRSNGDTVGNLADGCLEAQLANDIRAIDTPTVTRYGQGSAKIDFRLPCGGGLDILLDPAPDHVACRSVIDALVRREPARLTLLPGHPFPSRTYLPELRIAVFGEGPELEKFSALATAAAIPTVAFDKDRISLGQRVSESSFDEWTAVVLLFHDHEWEADLLEQALESDAFYIGAQGGESSRSKRALTLSARGVSEEQVARIRSPIGAIEACKSPTALALSALAEISGQYEHLLSCIR